MHHANGSVSGQSLQPGRAAPSHLDSPSRRTVSTRLYDDEESGSVLRPASSRQSKRARESVSPKKANKQQAATAAAIPTTPTKRQKNFLIRGNVTPSRAFSIFKAAKNRSQQRQQHGLMTPPTSSPLRPIILNSFDDLDGIDSSTSRRRGTPGGISSSSPLRSSIRSSQTFQSSSQGSAFSPGTSRYHASNFRPSAFGGGINSHPSLPQTLDSLHTKQPFHSRFDGLLNATHRFSAARPPAIDTSSFLETFVSPSSCHHQIPRSADEEYLSHPICAAYSYSSRSVNPSAQWLAVGDDEGRITLLNTLPWQDLAAEKYPANPQWKASASAAIFEVVWRFDDRSLLTGASDFSIRSWDTEYQQCTGEFEGHKGSPRTIVFDPTTNGDGGCGMVFASAGRDGTIRIWDARASSREGDGLKPVLTIDAAHSTMPPAGVTSGLKKPKQTRNVAVAVTGRGRKVKQQPLPAGVTALSYLPDGQGHKLLSGGSANGIIKCWDLRHVRQNQPSSPVSEVDPAATVSNAPISADWETQDLSLLTPCSTTGLGGSFRRAHGISQILSSSTSLYASCTGGKIYSLPLSTFLDSHLIPSEVQTLYDPVQCQNTLFSRMALFNDRFLAVGCNTGNIALWDVSMDRRSKSGSSRMEADTEEERRAAREGQMGFAYRSAGAEGMAVLTEGHAKNTEVNAVAWANGPDGPTLSSVGDDTNIRTWFADREAREGLSRVAEE